MIISNSTARPKLAADPSVLAQFSWMGKCHLASNSDSNSARQLCGRGKLFITSFIQFSFAIICIFTYFPLLFFFHSISFHDYDSFFFNSFHDYENLSFPSNFYRFWPKSFDSNDILLQLFRFPIISLFCIIFNYNFPPSFFLTSEITISRQFRKDIKELLCRIFITCRKVRKVVSKLRDLALKNHLAIKIHTLTL